MESTTKDRLLSVSEVAEWLGVSSAWVRDHAQGRRLPKLPAVKLGEENGKGLWKFLESAERLITAPGQRFLAISSNC